MIAYIKNQPFIHIHIIKVHILDLYSCIFAKYDMWLNIWMKAFVYILWVIEPLSPAPHPRIPKKFVSLKHTCVQRTPPTSVNREFLKLFIICAYDKHQVWWLVSSDTLEKRRQFFNSQNMIKREGRNQFLKRDII